jgi:hypothetical protein
MGTSADNAYSLKALPWVMLLMYDSHYLIKYMTVLLENLLLN